MQLSDVEPLLRPHLIDGETMREEPSDHYDDRMYTITTSGAAVHAYTLSRTNMYAIATLDVLEAWRPGKDIAPSMIDAVLDYARRNGQPAAPPDPEALFAPLVNLVRPHLQDGEQITVGFTPSGEPNMTVLAPFGGVEVIYMGDGMSALTSDGLGTSWPANRPDEGKDYICAFLADLHTRRIHD